MGLRISSYFIAIVLISVMFSMFYGLAGQLSNNDAFDITINDSYSDSFEALSSISDETDDSYQDAANWTVDKDSFLGLNPDSVSIVKNIYTTPVTITESMVDMTEEELGLPSWVGGTITTVMIVLAFFGLLAIILRYRYL